MIDLGHIFARLGLSQYLERFVQEGFDTWETVLDITESDLESLDVKLGHRRRLQREIANSRGQSSDQPLNSPTRPTPPEDRIPDRDERASSAKCEVKGTAGSGKRKYRRHPKPDENAPERAPSAYVIFSNKVREDIKDQNLSFTEIAKLVGEHWQVLPPAEKEFYESQALAAKERYNAELQEYKRTVCYRNYAEYLAEFKAKMAKEQQVDGKRPKLETQHTATNSSESASAQKPSAVLPFGRSRVGSMSSVGTYTSVTSGQPSPSTHASQNMKRPLKVESPVETAFFQSSSPTPTPRDRRGSVGQLLQRGGAMDIMPSVEGSRGPHQDQPTNTQQLPGISAISSRLGVHPKELIPHINDPPGLGKTPVSLMNSLPRSSIKSPAIPRHESSISSLSSGNTSSSSSYTPMTPLEDQGNRMQWSIPPAGVAATPGPSTTTSSYFDARTQTRPITLPGPLQISIPQPYPASQSSSVNSILANKTGGSECIPSGSSAISSLYRPYPPPPQQHSSRIGSQDELISNESLAKSMRDARPPSPLSVLLRAGLAAREVDGDLAEEPNMPGP